MMQKLTPKQEKFCQEYLELGSKTEAYKKAYSTARMKSETVNRNAHELLKRNKIATRVKQLRKFILDEKLYVVKESIKRDLKLLNKYEGALDVLQDQYSEDVAVKIAERTLKFIGIHGYSSTQDRLSKQLGFFEKDNSQKRSSEVVIFKIPDNNRGRKSHK